MKAYEIIKRHHRGFNLHGFYNRLGLYSRSFSALYSTVYFSPEIAQRKCDQLNKAHQGAIHTYCTINLSEFEVFTVNCVDIYFPEIGSMPDISTIEELYTSGGKPNQILELV